MRIIIRIELGQLRSLIGDAQIYNGAETAHAFIIIFFIIIPILIGGFGSWLISLILDASNIAFPRLNNIRFWFLLPALLMLIRGGGVNWVRSGTGWINTPLIRNIVLSLLSIDFAIFSLFLGVVSLLLGIINIVLCLSTFINKSQFYLLLHLFFLLFSIIFVLMSWTKYRVILSHKWQVSASEVPILAGNRSDAGILYYEHKIFYFCRWDQFACGFSYENFNDLEYHQLHCSHNLNSTTGDNKCT